MEISVFGRQSVKEGLYRIWCGVNRLGDSGVHTLGYTSAFVNPAGQLLFTGRGKIRMDGVGIVFEFCIAHLVYLQTILPSQLCDLPCFLQPHCLFVSEDNFCNLSYFILTMFLAHFIRLLTILPTKEAELQDNLVQILL